jgi:NAD(P)-dependent dehydrogenase (short-subunit alcohol dehydrogenase family)
VDRTVLITGGTGALGRAVVKHFVEHGSVVHVPWIAEPEVAELRALLGAAFPRVVLHRYDVTSESQVSELFGKIENPQSGGGIGILVNLVGGFTFAPLENTTTDDWDRMFRMNVTSAFLCCRAALPSMKAAHWGRIVNVSSAPALNHGAAKLSAYAASKAAVLNFTESLAKEVVSWGITVNAIVPTVIDTTANRRGTPQADTSTWLKPEEIAEVIGFLVSDHAAIVSAGAINLYRG